MTFLEILDNVTWNHKIPFCTCLLKVLPPGAFIAYNNDHTGRGLCKFLSISGFWQTLCLVTVISNISHKIDIFASSLQPATL